MIEQPKDKWNESKEETLKRRALELSKEIKKQKDIREATHVLIFKIGNELYGIDTNYIVEVIEVEIITEIPGMPSFAKGVFNLRGEILSALDLRELMEIPIQEDLHQDQLIIVRDEEMTFGIYTSEILETRYVFPEELKGSFAALNDFAKNKIKGITKDNLIVFEAKQLINDPNLVFKD